MRTQSMRSRIAGLVAMMAISLMVGVTAYAADTDIVINEVMQNPAVMSDTVGEWFEVHNTGATPVNMTGWTVSDDGTDSFVIGTVGDIPAGGFAVIGIDAATMLLEGVTLYYDYDGMYLGNSVDELVLTSDELVEIDRIVWDNGVEWPDPTGASMMFDQSQADNNIGANWAVATSVFGSGDMGTPGADNGGVPLQVPVVNNVYHRSILPEPAEAVTVYADATDSDGTISSVSVYYQVDGGGFISGTMSLVSGDTYSGTIPGQVDGSVVDYYVAATDNDAQTTTNPFDAPVGFYSYTVAPEVITSIASIHADSTGFDGAWVTVQAQVYIPGNHKADGVSVSAYVQDASNRGMNIYGTTRSTGSALLDDTTAIVKITGRVDWYYTTVELVNYEVELISSGNPVLTPSIQTTGNSAATSNEGTYVGTTGVISGILYTTGTNPAYNFTISDGSGDVVVRVDEDLALGMDLWAVNDELVANGAGGNYSGQGQIIVGLASDIVNNGQVADIVPPVLQTAELTTATTVTLQFDDNMDPVTGNVAGNYEVYETATPANTITVSAAAVQGDDTVIVLTLASSASGVAHTVRINNVQDTDTNVIAANTTMSIYEAAAPADIVITEIMQNPDFLFDSNGEWFEVYNAGASTVDMNGWTIKDLGTNIHVIDNGGPLLINPGEYKVLGLDATTMLAEGITLFYQYTAITLGNGDDEVILLDAGLVEIDAVAYDGGTVWPDPTGASMQWTGFGDNNDGSQWVVGGPTFGTGTDIGTPGLLNDWFSATPNAGLKTALHRNYPNPFNPKTSFNFTLKADDHVSLRVYDIRGREISTVVNAKLQAGAYMGVYEWDGRDNKGRDVNSGTYFYRLTTGSGYTESMKMTLLK
jgi:lamin tail-like protein/flagellar hook capping protein FlgD